MSFKVVIPARLGSTRLPRKPLQMIAGKPMIQWVVEAAQKSSAEQVVVATDEQEIVDAVTAFGAEVCLTRSDHPSGTDRLQEVAERYRWADDEIVVNVQGDEPLMPGAVIDQVANNLAQHTGASVATLSEPITHVEMMFDRNVVKLVKDHAGRALYFSRAPIPYARDSFSEFQPALPDLHLAQRHIGIYAYRVRLLHDFVRWPVAAMEVWEKLEQLRVLANGEIIHVEPACMAVPGGVDTEQDLTRIRAIMEQVQ